MADPFAIKVHHRWWLRYYVVAVVLGCRVTGRKPNLDRVGRWIERGLVVRVVRLRALLVA